MQFKIGEMLMVVGNIKDESVYHFITVGKVVEVVAVFEETKTYKVVGSGLYPKLVQTIYECDLRKFDGDEMDLNVLKTKKMLEDKLSENLKEFFEGK